MVKKQSINLSKAYWIKLTTILNTSYEHGSTDNTENILKEYADKSQTYHILKTKNMGLTFSLNFLIKKSNGTYLADKMLMILVIEIDFKCKYQQF